MQITIFEELLNSTGRVTEFKKSLFLPKELAKKKDGALFSPAIFEGNRRTKENIKFCNACVLDFDNEDEDDCMSFEEVKQEINDYHYIAHSTWSNSKERPKFRIIFPLSQASPPQAYEKIVFHCLDLMGNPSGVDISCREPSRAYFLPAYNKDNKELSFYEVHKGIYIEPDIDFEVEEKIYNSYKGAEGRNEKMKAVVVAKLYDGDDLFDIIDYVVSMDRMSNAKKLFADPEEFGKIAATPRLAATRFVTNIAESVHKEELYGCFELSEKHRGKKKRKFKKSLIQKPHCMSVDFLKKTDGPIGLIARDIYKNSQIFQPPVAMAAAINIVGTLKGHTRKTLHGGELRTNFYTIATTEAGCGKDIALRYSQKLFEELGIHEVVQNSIDSFKGFNHAFKLGHGVCLVTWDEFGKDLKNILNRNSGANYLSRIADFLLRAFSSASFFMKEGIKADAKDAELITVHNPILNVLGVTVPDPLFGAFDLGYVEDGLIPRFLYFPCERGEKNKRKKPLDISFEVLNACKEYSKALDVYKKKNGFIDLKNLTPKQEKYIEIIPTAQAKIIEYSDEAKELLAEIEEDFEKWRGGKKDRVRTAVYSRAIEQIKKLALVYCDEGIIDTKHLFWAQELYFITSEKYIFDLKMRMSQDGVLKFAQIIERSFKEQGVAVLTKSQIRKGKSLTTQQLKEGLQYLMDVGYLVGWQESNKVGRPTEFYNWKG